MNHAPIVDIAPLPVIVSWRTVWKTVRITLEDGTSGLGEYSDAGTTEFSGASFTALAHRLIGMTVPDALDAIADQAVWAAARLAASEALPAESTVVGGLDQALCDLAAQATGVPLSRWLGGTGTATEIRAYANINRGARERTPYEFARLGREAVEAGFTAVKCAPFDFLVGERRLDTGLRLIEALREEVGDGVDLMLDAHHTMNIVDLAAWQSRVAALNLYWIEDIAFLHDREALIRVRDLLPGVKVAGGEFATRADQVLPVLKAGLLDVFMPDVKHAGGVRATVDLAREAVAANPAVEISIHNPTGPVSTAHSVHASLAAPNAHLLEYAFGEVDWRENYLTPGDTIRRGTLRINPAVNGLGVALDPVTAAKVSSNQPAAGHSHPGPANFRSLV